MDIMFCTLIVQENQIKCIVFKNCRKIGDTLIFLSPQLVTGEKQFVLRWKDTPRDLDLHSIGSDGTHVYYSAKNYNSGNYHINLDIDVTSGKGPETMTMKNLPQSASYHIGVYNYTGDPAITTSDARVNIPSLGQEIEIKNDGNQTSRWWWVCSIVNDTITVVNKIITTSADSSSIRFNDFM